MQKQLYINNNGASKYKLLLENGEDGRKTGWRKEVSNYQFNFNIIVPTPQINTKNALFAPIRGLLAFDISNSVDKLF